MWRKINLTKRLMTQYTNNHLERLACKKCGEPLEEGSSCHSHSGHRTRYYCNSCYNGLWM